jgi:hypothetical protein
VIIVFRRAIQKALCLSAPIMVAQTNRAGWHQTWPANRVSRESRSTLSITAVANQTGPVEGLPGHRFRPGPGSGAGASPAHPQPRSVWWRRRRVVHDREKDIRASGGSLEPPGPLPTNLPTVYMVKPECLPTGLKPLAERACFCQVHYAGPPEQDDPPEHEVRGARPPDRSLNTARVERY